MHQLISLISKIQLNENELQIPKSNADSGAFGTALELAFAALGATAFIIMVVAGLKFVTSRGNPDGVAKARNTVIYAAIGLVLSLLSFSIVRFVVGNM